MIVYPRKLSVPGFAHPAMEQMTNVSGWVDRLDDMAVRYLRCRRFYLGRDAPAAIAAMGLFPSQLGATRVVVTYEHADMALQWEDPAADEAPTGIVVVDAGHDAARDGHTVRWHPS